MEGAGWSTPQTIKFAWGHQSVTRSGGILSTGERKEMHLVRWAHSVAHSLRSHSLSIYLWFDRIIESMAWSHVETPDGRVCVCVHVRNECDDRNTLKFSFDDLRLRNNHFAQFWIPCAAAFVSVPHFISFVRVDFLCIRDPLSFCSVSFSLAFGFKQLHPFIQFGTSFFRFGANRNREKKVLVRKHFRFDHFQSPVVYGHLDRSFVRNRFVAVSFAVFVDVVVVAVVVFLEIDECATNVGRIVVFRLTFFSFSLSLYLK